MEYVIIGVSAFLISSLTLFSGFGLGTLLMPVFALFFPVEVAVAATAVVHAANSALKIGVVGGKAAKPIVIQFGIPAVIAAFAGAAALGYVSHLGELTRYMLGTHVAVITPVKLVMGAVMLVFALFELLPGLRRIKFERKHLLLGGVLSGFFGGFSGHQGALRSAFLTKVGISTEAFVGTNAVLGFMVDMARIMVYAVTLLLTKTRNPLGPEQLPLILTGVAAAFAGVMIARRFLHKVTMEAVQTVAGVLLCAIALALASGIV